MKKNKTWQNFLVGVAFSWVSMSGILFAGINSPQASEISESLCFAVENIHYTQKQLSQIKGKTFLDNYLKALDFRRRVFIQSDIDEFMKLYEDNIINRTKNGDLEPGFQIMKRFALRFKQRYELVKRLVKEDFNFDVDESITLARDKMPWPKNEKEVEALWRLQVKYELLRGILNKKSKKKTVKTLLRRMEQKLKSTKESTKISDVEDLLGTYLSALTQAYDPHSIYLTPSEAENFSINNIKLKLTGIGAVLEQSEEGYAKIRELVPGGPAYLSKALKPGDQISAVGQGDKGEAVDIVDMKLNKVVQLIRGKVNTKVRLTVIPADAQDSLETKEVSLIRKEVNLVDRKAKAQVIEIPPSSYVAPTKKNQTSSLASSKLEETNLASSNLSSSNFKSSTKESQTKTLSISTKKIQITKQPSSKKEVKTSSSSSASLKILSKESQDLKKYAPMLIKDFKPEYKIGVITLPEFYEGSSRDVRNLINRLKKEKINGLILDLRKNGGGILEEAIKITGLFIHSGPVVQVRDFRGRIRTLEDEHIRTAYKGPLLVLVTQLSASASEIVAAALQDYGRALIVGGKSTHGKGTVQSLNPLNKGIPNIFLTDMGQIKITISKFYRIAGSSTQKIGVTPDIVLPSIYDYLELGEATLPHALSSDEITPVRHINYKLVKKHINKLREKSLKRVKASQDFIFIREDIDQLKERQKEKKVSLSKKIRMKEKKERKERQKKRRKVRAERPLIRENVYDLTLKMLKNKAPLKPYAPEKKDIVKSEDEEEEDLEMDEEVDIPIDPTLREGIDIMCDYLNIQKKKKKRTSAL